MGNDSYHGGPPPRYQDDRPTHFTPAVVVAAPPILGSTPVIVNCPSCGARQMTEVHYEANTKTHLMALIVCLVCFPCVCVPYCCDSCQTAVHSCGRCKALIGIYEN